MKSQMRKQKQSFNLLLVALLFISFLSCGVPKSEYFSLKRSYEKLQSNHDYLKKKYDACEAENKALEKEYKGGAVATTIQHEDIKIELLQCTQTGNQITCELLYTNKRKDDKRFHFYNTPKAYEMKGKSHTASTMLIGEKSINKYKRSVLLPLNTPVKGTFTFDEFDGTVSKLKTIIFKTYLNPKLPIEFKNIPIKQYKS